MNMTAKEYLGQAYRLDQRINSKLEQVLSLRDLTTKATATMSDMPGGGSRNVYKMQDIIGKIIDLENEINADIDQLVDLKREMVAAIKAVENPKSTNPIPIETKIVNAPMNPISVSETLRTTYRPVSNAINCTPTFSMAFHTIDLFVFCLRLSIISCLQIL